MAATQTVPQHPQHCNFAPIIPRHGVITLFGYGIRVHVDRGHLTVQDGIGAERREARLPRVGHGLKRLVVIGADGVVSLSAHRWLADQNAAFVMLERDGSVLATTGPVRPSDARLRRAQALAHQSGIALGIARELISQKLIAQEKVIRNYFQDTSAVQPIINARNRLAKAKTNDEIRLCEAHAAVAYWTAWHELPITYPRVDLPKVPDHWRVFGSRLSPLTKSLRLAVNPPNAMLNYLYALLESESRLALAALGLDPGLGVLHIDSRTRDSLACDLMEPVRPQVDAFLLDWLSRAPLNRAWFFEQRNGNCRLTSPLASQLSETSEIWSRAVAPFAEGIARSLWSMTSRQSRLDTPATRLTQNRKRDGRGSSAAINIKPISEPSAICMICGNSIKQGNRYCQTCAPTVSRENLIEVAKKGRVATISPEAQERRSVSQRRQAAALKTWSPSQKPDWLDEKTYREIVLPRLAAITVPAIRSALEISEPYAANIRAGRCIPHPRHWFTLAKLTGYQE